MKKQEYKEVALQEIADKFNCGASKNMLVKYVSASTGLKDSEALKIVEKAIYKDYMQRIKTQ